MPLTNQTFSEASRALAFEQSCEFQRLGDEHDNGPLRPLVAASEPENEVSDEIHNRKKWHPLDVIEHGVHYRRSLFRVQSDQSPGRPASG
jgi:hypothetical protein